MTPAPTPGGELLPEAPPCPFCSGSQTELMSAFGGQLSVATYWCRACSSPFEFMKWSETEPRDSARRGGGGSS